MKQLFWVKFGLGVAAVFFIVFATVSGYGIKTLSDSGEFSTRTSQTIEQIMEAQSLHNLAMDTGRKRLVGEVVPQEQLEVQRTASINSISTLKEFIAGDVDQEEALEGLKYSIEARFATQDLQYSTLRKLDNGSAQFENYIIIDSNRLTTEVESAFIKARVNTIAQLVGKDREQRELYWKIVYGTLLSLFVIACSIILVFYLLFNQLNVRRLAIDRIHETEDHPLDKQLRLELTRILNGVAVL